MGNIFTSNQASLNNIPGDILSPDATRDNNITGDATFMCDATHMGEGPLNRVDYVVPTTTNLKLEAQKITDFDGSFGNWENWKLSTQCALEGSGYIQVLVNQNFAVTHPHLNRIVYSQLARATINGNAFHLVKAFESTKDAFKTWENLCEWYDGEDARHDTAVSLRNKLDNLKLSSSTTASIYINKFLTWYQDLQKIPGESLSDSFAIQLFLKNIEDPEYEITVRYLRNSSATLKNCVTTLRKDERDLIQKRIQKRKLRNLTRRIMKEDNRNNQRPSKIRRTHAEDVNKHEMIQLKPSPKGLLGVDEKVWATLDEKVKSFIQQYNSNVKHNEPTSNIEKPQNVMIKPRRNETFNSDESSTKPNSPQRNANKNSKKITFHVNDSKANHENDS